VSKPKLPAEVDYILLKENVGYVGASGKNLSPHVTPVIFVYDGKSIFFVTSKIAKKLQHIRENNRVAFLVDCSNASDERSNNIAVMIRGRAKIYNLPHSLLHPFHLLKIGGMFVNKYPEYFKAYVRENRQIPKSWQPILFLHRSLVRIDIEKYHLEQTTRYEEYESSTKSDKQPTR